MVRGKPLSFDREEVLAKAMELFWRHGFKNTGMSELLAHIGIQRQSFYNTFGSKEKVYLEAVALYTRTIIKEITALLDQPGNPLDNIRMVLGMMRDMVSGADACGCMLGNSIAEFGLTHPEISKLLKEKVASMEKAFERTFSKAIAQGLIPKTKDPVALAQSLIVMAQGMALMSKLGIAEDMLEGVMKTAQEMITD